MPALLAALACIYCDAIAATPDFRVEDRSTLRMPSTAATNGQHTLTLTLANIGGWNDTGITAAVTTAAGILAQCGLRLAEAELLRIRVPASHRDFDTPRSLELARALPLRKPAIYFAAGTRQRPAFDAEAIGRGNSRTRPELADTVWIIHGARDPGIVIAHELAHVLMDSGEHDNTPGNLMAEETTPDNTRLTPAQCARITATGTRNGLLQAGVD
ncbi:MAG: hypothetical protein KF771_10865 [Burkholderiales bacterium]|nr:hypothetical protein [Burkholderiales bacterium]